MVEDNNQHYEEMESIEEQKIGFSSSRPLSKKDKKIERYQDKLPGKPLRVWTRLLTVFGIIFSILSAMYFLLPLFSVVIGAMLALMIVLFMICSVVFTFGAVLTIDGYREWISNDMMVVPNFFFNISENITQLAHYYFVVAGPGIAFTSIGLLLAIIGKAQKYYHFTSFIVLNAIFLSVVLFFTALYGMFGIQSYIN